MLKRILIITFEQLIETIRSIPKGIVPFTLSDWGVNKKMLNDIVEQSFTKGRMDNNIVDLSTDDVLGILKELYSE